MSVETLKTALRESSRQQDETIAKLQEKLAELEGKVKAPTPQPTVSPPVVPPPPPVVLNDEKLDRAAAELQSALRLKLGSGKSVSVSAKQKLLPVIVREAGKPEKTLAVAFEKSVAGSWQPVTSVDEIALAANPPEPPKPVVNGGASVANTLDPGSTGSVVQPHTGDGNGNSLLNGGAGTTTGSTPNVTVIENRPPPPPPVDANKAPYWITQDGKRVLVIPGSKPPPVESASPADHTVPSPSKVKPVNVQAQQQETVKPSPESTQATSPVFRRVPSPGESTKVNLPKVGEGGGDVRGSWKDVGGKKVFVPTGSAK